MFRRRSCHLFRQVAIICFFTGSLILWLQTPSSTNKQSRLSVLPQVSLVTLTGVIDMKNQSDGLKQTHHHSNQSLEEFRKNMTLLKVNMSGIMERIHEVNKSKGVVMHKFHKHQNVPNPHDFEYLLNVETMCSNKDVFLIIYVHTAPAHYKRRMVIRQTWGNPKYFPDVVIRLVFVMGRVEGDKNAQDALVFEHEQYRDIVQEDFLDSYKNLTYKGIAALKWISTYCSHAKFVLKTDDDIFVNMFTMLRHLQTQYHLNAHNHGLMMCLVWSRMKVMREGKWKISKDEFKEDYYPTYCSGSAFAMTTDTALRLHEVSYHVPFFWVDDFYVTGLLPIKAGNITHKQLMSTFVLDGRKLEDKFTGPQWFTYIFSHVHDLNLIQSVWDRLVLLARGEVSAKVKYALPGELPDEKEIRRKEKEAEKKKEEERKKKEAEKKKKEAAKKEK